MWGIGKKEAKRQKYTTAGRVMMIPTEEIQPSPDQPRREFSYQGLLELAQSIGEHGLLHPLTVVFREGEPVLVAGERRLRAAKIAGLREIPCVEREADRREAALLALIENLQREDLNCFEEAEGYRRLIELYGLTQEEAAAELGCAQPTIANKLRLLRLTAAEQKSIIAHSLSERHARALLRLEDPAVRAMALERMITGRMTVAQADRLVAELLCGRTGSSGKKRAIPLIRDVRLFFNTVSHAVDTMRRSGIRACAEQSETEEYIEYIVRIPKREAIPRPGRPVRKQEAQTGNAPKTA